MVSKPLFITKEYLILWGHHMSIDKLLLEIYELIESEDYEKSLELCNQILEFDENNKDA